MNKYSINVSINGKHYCKIEISETSRDEAEKKFDKITAIYKKLPTDNKTVELTMTEWVTVGHEVKRA